MPKTAEHLEVEANIYVLKDIVKKDIDTSLKLAVLLAYLIDREEVRLRKLTRA